MIRPLTAFGGWKRCVRTLNVINIGIPVQQAVALRVSRARPSQCCCCRTRLFSADNRDAAANDPQETDSESSRRHIVLDSIEESFESNIFSNLPGSSKDDVVLLVGVSGGCDSVGLLHALVHNLTRVDDNKFQFPNFPNTSFQLHVVHFNHMQRGAESDGDAQFVQELCDELDLPCHVYDWQSSSDDCIAFSQDKARQWRRLTMYSLLQSLSEGGTGVIVTAHHRDDSEESMMLKLLRGVHLTNLVGMDPVIVGSKDMPNAIIVRPMLNVRKADIVDYLQSNHLEWREDESNASDKYLRNRVRNELVPLLSDMMGGEDVLQVRDCALGEP